jgi:hypothetical protein
VLVWSEALALLGTTSTCGISTSPDSFVTRELDLGWVNGDTVRLQFASTIDSAGTDESCARQWILHTFFFKPDRT